MLSEPFAKININSTKDKVKFNGIINNYSNDIQLYYEYLPQDESKSLDIQYFNNCWKSDNFYQQQQRGGSNYPYKFAIVSGSIDSSKLGGQSIPQYHPPEIDLYMPIFELSGNGNLRGIIVRMTFVKEVLVNAINSKSQVVVFCHFVYIDLINSQITVQKTSEGLDIRSDYPNVFNQLLKFAVEKTEYIGKEDKCIDIETDLQEKTNLNDRETDIEFIIKFPGDKRKNWYKFFTYTYGPSVQTSIVIPVNNNSIDGLKIQCRSDYVAAGIVNVAENLLADGESLRMVFNDDKEKLLFVKLFLIRNKYTGDKSRSTDTLFLNQTKYLEGVQISNDENTLYNAQMFGLNTVWSTQTKTVFYLAPYLTKNTRVPITTGVYVNQLCNGLKNNPNFKTSISAQEDEPGSSGKEVNAEEKRIIDDFIEEVLSKIDPDVLDRIEKKNPKFMDTKENNSFLQVWSYSVYYINLLRNILQEVKELDITTDLNAIWENYKSLTPEQQNIEFKTFSLQIKETVYEYFENINKKYDLFKTKYAAFKNNYKIVYERLIRLLQICNDNGDLLKLKNMIVLLNKTIPLWIESLSTDINNTMSYYYCNTIYTALNILNSYITDISKKNINLDKPDEEDKNLICTNFWAYKTILGIIGTGFASNNGKAKYWKDLCDDSIIDNNSDTVKSKINTSDDCVKALNTINKGVAEKAVLIKKITIFPPEPIPEPKYLEELDTSKADSNSIENNENKFTLVSLELLDDFNKRLVNQENILTKYDGVYAENLKNPDRYVNADELSTIEESIEKKLGEAKRFARPQPTKIVERPTDRVGGFKEDESQFEENILKENTSQIGGVIISPTLNKETLQKFYENSYKCNIGNYLKGFVEMIQSVNKKYSNLSFENITSCQELIIKIAMLNIENINKSFVPKIETSDILNKIIAIDNSYSVDEMISILNTYKYQLDMYGLINSVELNDYTNIEIINLLNENITDIALTDLDLPYSKYELTAMLLELPIVTSEIMTPSSQSNLTTSTFSKPATSLSESVKSIQQNKARAAPMIDYTKLGLEPYQLGQQQLGLESSYSRGIYSNYGGISFKNRKRNRNTIKNKIKSKKQTIKKRNKRHNKTRKH